MTELVIRTYCFLRSRRWLRWGTLLVSTLLLVALVLRLGYKEDISDFLPLDSQHHNALRVYQDVAGANKLFAIFQCKDTTKADPGLLVSAIDDFVERTEQADTSGMVSGMVSRVDMETLGEVSDFVYTNIPYFLTEADYARMDSLLRQPDYVRQQMAQDKQMLMFPTGGLLSDNIGRDPLNLFTPVVARLQGAGSGMKYEMYDGCIFSPDMKKAIVVISSPFGASETENNTRLLSLLQSCADSTVTHVTNTEIHLTGSPAIAVGNSRQIKADSILSVGLAVVLILAFLLVTFRNVRNLLLIAVSIAWGWLFAMGGLALFHDSVSIIVLGISSVIVGIAVNYPLHFIAHLSHTPDKTKALREIVMPLVVGNVTTVGAFLALVPLQSTALRDLGLFASFLLVGTIVFVLLYLPHLSAVRQQSYHTFLDRIGEVSLENKSWVVAVVVVMTLVFGYYSFQTGFDANMSHINYMTDEQKADMEYFSETMLKTDATKTVYALSTDSTMDGALDKSLRLQPTLRAMAANGLVQSHSGCSQFLCSKAEQQRRLKRWQSFVKRHRDLLTDGLRQESAREGFAESSFDGFNEIVAREYLPQPAGYFEALRRSVFSVNVSTDSIRHTFSVVDIVTLEDGMMDKVKAQLGNSGAYAFDVASMNSAIANHLSDDFNYIGWACGCIVFFFLWLSLGSLELALLSFVPMAVSWVWILGIMGLCDIQFNIVNVILATFIFGQGDDYTIFMTEGACYEYAYRRKMLASYKHSIIISALIMFIGIGSLIVAKHPALHSLAEVTIAGMFSVVLMAYIFPPLIFKFLVGVRNGYRKRPLSLKPLLVMAASVCTFFVQLGTVYVLGFLLFKLLRPTEARKRWLHRYVGSLYRFDLGHIPGVRYVVDNPEGEDFKKPTVVVSNHQSMIDAAIFMALSPRLLLVSNGHASSNPVIRQVFRWLDFVCLPDDEPIDLSVLKAYVEQGYSIVVFPEGERNPRSSILRFHKGAFYLAEQLGLDIVPVVLHGMNNVLPRNSVSVFPGQLTVKVLPRIAPSDPHRQQGYAAMTKHLHKEYVRLYAELAHSIETADYFLPLVRDRYRYKGVEIFGEVCRHLKRRDSYAPWLGHVPTSRCAVFLNAGYGELALLYALVHPDVQVTAVEADADKATVARYSTEGIAPNVRVQDTVEAQADAWTIDINQSKRKEQKQ